jgi:ketosteroid isomerase-like protein
LAIGELTTEFLLAEAAVRQLHSRYIDAVFRADLDAFGQCFAQQAEWRVGGRILRGRPEIMDFMRAVFPQFERIFMTFRTPLLHIGDDGAISSRTYVSEDSRFADGRPFAPIGIYFEHFTAEEGRLRFKWRLFQTRYAGPPDLSGTFFDVPDYGPPPGMPPLDEDTFDRSGVGPKASGTVKAE